MNNEIAEMWAQALESGKYKQGHRKLVTQQHEFCCLGVLCDLYMQNHPECKWKFSNIIGFVFCDEDGGEEPFRLPGVVQRWAAMKTNGGYYGRRSDQSYTLTKDNDSGASFAMIAETIRRFKDDL